METGAVEILYRAHSERPKLLSQSLKLDIPTVPEFYRETNFKD